MGAAQFIHVGFGKTAKEAFASAYKEACYEYGNRGGTGTLAEKDEFTEIPLPVDKEPEPYAYELMQNSDDRVDDKYGPAGCFKIRDGEYMFFGWASE